MKKLVLLTIIVVALLTGILAFIFYSNTIFSPKKKVAATIVLTKNGFIPNRVTIKENEAIEFKTENGTFFWPASDLHPTHEKYPGFDPEKPIAADESWIFTFNKKGNWTFHDHLAPYYTGIITVK